MSRDVIRKPVVVEFLLRAIGEQWCRSCRDTKKLLLAKEMPTDDPQVALFEVSCHGETQVFDVTWKGEDDPISWWGEVCARIRGEFFGRTRFYSGRSWMIYPRTPEK